MNKLELTGRADSHIVYDPDHLLAAEKETGTAFRVMAAEASKAGLKLKAYSAFRSFQSQLAIWNAKYSGERTIYDLNGNALNHHSLKPSQLIPAILSWSALPGASRHHWGTDIDIIDEAALPPDYQVRLLPSEFAKDGVFYQLGLWLEDNMDRFGFFKPYRDYRGGISIEPWHLSYKPVADQLLEQISENHIREAISESNMRGKEAVLEILPELLQTYVMNICS